LLNNNHYDPKAVSKIADGVTGRWQQLVTRAEERHKLVTASLNFYKTAEQVRRRLITYYYSSLQSSSTFCLFVYIDGKAKQIETATLTKQLSRNWDLAIQSTLTK